MDGREIDPRLPLRHEEYPAVQPAAFLTGAPVGGVDKLVPFVPLPLQGGGLRLGPDMGGLGTHDAGRFPVAHPETGHEGLGQLVRLRAADHHVHHPLFQALLQRRLVLPDPAAPVLPVRAPDPVGDRLRLLRGKGRPGGVFGRVRQPGYGAFVHQLRQPAQTAVQHLDLLPAQLLQPLVDLALQVVQPIKAVQVVRPHRLVPRLGQEAAVQRLGLFGDIRRRRPVILPQPGLDLLRRLLPDPLVLPGEPVGPILRAALAPGAHPDRLRSRRRRSRRVRYSLPSAP